MTTTSAAAAEIKRVALNRLFYAPNSSEYGRHDEPVVGWDMIIFGGLHIQDDAVLNICITKDRPPAIHPSYRKRAFQSMMIGKFSCHN